ncbi:CFA20 domain-containing protein [Plasmodiophora brassicae]
MTQARAAAGPQSGTSAPKAEVPVPGSLFGKVFQDPTFDLMKQMKAAQVSPKREGEVEQVMDRSTGSYIYELKGLVPAANYLQFPSSNTHSLGLTGPYLYMQIRRPNADTHFSLHFDLLATIPQLVVRLSFSNLFRERKSLGRVIQIPLTQVKAKKWTVLCVDFKSVMSQYSSFEFTCLKAIKVCACIQLRGVYTSSKIYDPSTLPRDMRLPIAATEDWMSVYDWLWCPKTPVLEGSTATSDVAEGANSPIPRDGHSEAVVAKDALPRKTQPEKKRVSTTAIVQADDSISSPGPDPVLELFRIVGYNGSVPGSMKWLEKNTVLYTAMSMVVIHDIATDEQIILTGHTANICALAICPFYRLLVTGQSGRHPFLLIWDLKTKTVVCRVPTFANGLTSLAISCDSRLLACAGHDGHGRVQIIVWDLSDVVEKGTVSVVAKQTSEFNVSQIVFSPHPGSQHQLASCGHESIRFWRIKNGHLPGHSLVLNEHSRNTFVALCFEPIYGIITEEMSRPHLLYAASASGAVFVADLDTTTLRYVYQLHNGPIRAIVITQGFCITGSDDKHLRVWPMDFSSCVTEAQHDSPITSVSVSEDGLRAIAGCSSGSAGTLDITDSSYRVYLRSHSGAISDVCVSPRLDEFATASSDGTVRIWDIASHQQLYEFLTPVESAICVAYHPQQNQLALGFASGKIRIIDIASTTMIVECCQHTGPVRSLVYTPDGRRLFSASDDRHICAFDVLRFYQPVRVLGASFSNRISICCDPKGLLLAAPGPMGCNEIVVYNVDNFGEQQRIILKSGGSRIIQFHPIINEVVIATTTRTLIRFDLSSRRVVGETVYGKLGDNDQNDLSDLRISPDGKFIVYADNANSVRVVPYRSVGDPSFALSGQEFRSQSAISSLEFVDCDLLVTAGGTVVQIWKFHPDRYTQGDAVLLATPTRSSRASASKESSLSPRRNIPVPTSPSAVLSPVRLSSTAFDSSQTSGPRRRLSISEDDVVEECPEQFSKCLFTPLKTFPRATVGYVVPAHKEALRVQQVLAYNGNGRNNVIWHPPTGLFCFTAGSIIVVEDLADRTHQILQAHSVEISCLAVTDGGDILASADGGLPTPTNPFSMIFLWSPATRQPTREITTKHAAGIQAMAFNASGTYLTSVGRPADSSVCVWDCASGECIAYHAASTSNVDWYTAVCWVPRINDQFLTCSRRKVESWTAPPPRFALPADEVTCFEPRLLPCAVSNRQAQSKATFTAIVALSTHFFVGTSNGDVIIWQYSSALSDWECLGDVICFPNEILSMHIVPCQRELDNTFHLVLAGAADFIRRCEIAISDGNPKGKINVEEVGQLRFNAGAVVACRWDPSAQVGVVGFDYGTVVQVGWSSATTTDEQSSIATPTRLVNGHRETIQQVAFSPTRDEFMCSCGDDGSVRLWDVPKSTSVEGAPFKHYEQIMHFQVPNQKCNCVSFAPSGTTIAAGFTDGCIRVLDLMNLELRHCVKLAHAVDHVIHSANGRIIIAATSDGIVHVIDSASFDVHIHIANHSGNRIHCLEQSTHDDHLFLVCDSHQQVSLWNSRVADGRDNWDAILYRWINMSQAFSAQQDVFQELDDVPGFMPPNLAIFDKSSSSNLIACCPSTRPLLHVFDFELNEVVRVLPLPHTPLCVSMSNDGALLAVGTIDWMITLVDVSSGTFQDVPVHCDRVSAIAFSNSSKVVSASGHVMIAHVLADGNDGHHQQHVQ